MHERMQDQDPAPWDQIPDAMKLKPREAWRTSDVGGLTPKCPLFTSLAGTLRVGVHLLASDDSCDGE